LHIRFMRMSPKPTSLIVFCLPLIMCLLLSFEPPSSKSVELHFTHFRNDTGFARIAVYNNPLNFCKESIKPFREISAKIVHRQCSVTISDLPDGDYAITLLHDENEDAIMNYDFLGLPKEGFAFSNNALPGFTKPGFNACKIKVKAGITVKQTIKVLYLF